MLNYKDYLRYNKFTMIINEEAIVEVEKISNQGYGIARINGFVIFIENSCPQDKLKIKITKINKNFAFGKIQEILKPSPYRTTPFCSMQKICGACQLQHISYAEQLKIKKQITEDAIKTIAKLDIKIFDTKPSPQIKNYRHKIQYPITQTKNSKRLLAGYYKPKTHNIVNIKYCPIQPEICDKIIDFIRQNASHFEITGYNEINHAGILKHVVIRNSNLTNNNLVALVINESNISDNLRNFAYAIYNEFKQVTGVCVNFNPQKTNVILGPETKCLIGEDFITEQILDKKFRIQTNTFFQVNPQSAENIFKYVRDYLKNNFKKPFVLDAYAGITSFGICISDICEKVVSVEENKHSCELAKIVANENNITNIEINNMDAGKFFSKETRKYDAVIIDPPRKGCSEESLDQAFRVTKNKIIYVSCNPATLARDLKHLTDKGCTVESIQPFDMFCHTYHVENVAIISKNQ